VNLALVLLLSAIPPPSAVDGLGHSSKNIYAPDFCTDAGICLTALADGGGGAPGGSPNSIQFNNGGAFGGFGSWDGTTLFDSMNLFVDGGLFVQGPSTLDNGAITTDGSGDPTINNSITFTGSGIIVAPGDLYFNAPGSVHGQNNQLDNADGDMDAYGPLTAHGTFAVDATTSLDNGAITTDGYGSITTDQNITVGLGPGTLSVGNGVSGFNQISPGGSSGTGVNFDAPDGLYLNTVNAAPTTIGGTLAVVGSTTLDNGAIVTSGTGTITLPAEQPIQWTDPYGVGVTGDGAGDLFVYAGTDVYVQGCTFDNLGNMTCSGNVNATDNLFANESIVVNNSASFALGAVYFDPSGNATFDGLVTLNAGIQFAPTNSYLYDQTGSDGTAGQVLTAGTGAQVVWADPSGGDSVWQESPTTGGVISPIDATNTAIQLTSTGSVTTTNNTLDDDTGNATFSGYVSSPEFIVPGAGEFTNAGGAVQLLAGGGLLLNNGANGGYLATPDGFELYSDGSQDGFIYAPAQLNFGSGSNQLIFNAASQWYGLGTFNDGIFVGGTTSLDNGAITTDGSGDVSAVNVSASQAGQFGFGVEIPGGQSYQFDDIPDALQSSGSGALTVTFNGSGTDQIQDNGFGALQFYYTGQVEMGGGNFTVDTSGNLTSVASIRDVENLTASTLVFADPSTNLVSAANANLVTAGLSPLLASANLTGQTAANSSIATFTPSATGTYRIGGYVTITAVSADVVQFQVTYTDETSTVRTQTFTPQGLTSAGLSAVGSYTFPPMDIRASASAITVKTILTTSIGSITYDVGATIQQLN
jgi:hypothetical protein